MPWLAIAGIASAASGIGNLVANTSANDRAAMLQNQALQNWMNVNVPDPAEQRVILEKFVNQGVLDPKLQSAIKQDPSQFEKIVTNAKYQAAQNNALSQLEEIGNSGGLRLQDKAALQESMLENQARDRANRQAISADMQRRGLGGSGFEVASQLQGQQATADRDAQNSLKIAAEAQNRALKAIEGAGQLAGQFRGQDFNEQSARATAADRINQFNTQNLRDVSAANTAALNRAQEVNLQNAQDIANRNTQLANQEQMHNKSLVQQQFQNQAQKAAGMSGQYGQLAQNAQRQGQLEGNAISNIGGGLAGAASAQANSSFWDDYFKKNKSSGT
jgi:hypothetical protein